MEETSVVYGLRCVCHNAGYRYVGKTKHGLHDRLVCHIYESQRNTTRPLYKWVRKHGAENIRADVLEYADTNEELCISEIQWIEFLGTHVSEGGLNVTLGGEGALGVSSNPGEKNYWARMTNAEVESIKKDAWFGVRKLDILKKYGITGSMYDKIRCGDSWTHIPWPEGAPSFTHGSATLTYQQVSEIKAALRAGVPGIQLVKRYNSSRNAISAINTGKTWKHVPWPDVVT